MNQIVGTDEYGGAFLCLLLEPGNIHKLTQGAPIKVHVGASFPDGIPKELDLLISYSETPVQDFNELSKDTGVAFNERNLGKAKLRPHCPECRSTVEQMGIFTNESPVVLVCCSVCGCTLGAIAKASIGNLHAEK